MNYYILRRKQNKLFFNKLELVILKTVKCNSPVIFVKSDIP